MDRPFQHDDIAQPFQHQHGFARAMPRAPGGKQDEGKVRPWRLLLDPDVPIPTIRARQRFLGNDGSCGPDDQFVAEGIRAGANRADIMLLRQQRLYDGSVAPPQGKQQDTVFHDHVSLAAGSAASSGVPPL
jgi:hypothetical protein